MKIAALVALVALAVCPTAGASRGGPEKSQARKAPSKEAAATKQSGCPYAHAGVAFYRSRFVRWQLQRGASVPAWRQPRNCADARYLANVWATRAKQSRQATERYLVELERKTLHERPTWVRAIREAQKAYPGTEWWLRSCSSWEGAGRHLSVNDFVMNHEGSDAGGWLQFMEGTFWRMFGAAKAEVESRGFVVPREAVSWSSRIGQALAGGWAVKHHATHEWSGSGC